MDLQRKITYHALREPTEQNIQYLISNIENFCQFTRDFLIYAVGFTHYKEASNIFAAYNLKLIRNPTGIIYDLNRCIYRKIALINLYHNAKPLNFNFINNIYSCRYLKNIIYNREINGEYVKRTKSWEPFPTIDNYMDYAKLLTFNCNEDILIFPYNIKDFISPKTVYFLTQTVQNLVSDISRLLCHASAIVIAPENYDRYTCSLKRMRDAHILHEDFRNAIWFILGTGYETETLEFVNALGAKYFYYPNYSDEVNYVQYVLDYFESLPIDLPDDVK